jgi:hypothetical protein
MTTSKKRGPLSKYALNGYNNRPATAIIVITLNLIVAFEVRAVK